MRLIRLLTVTPRAGLPSQGWLVAGGLRLPCALGRAGIRHDKREGDGATPAGRFGLVAGWFRADRLRCPPTALVLSAIRPGDGWCDAPHDRNYNRPVRLPYPAHCEAIWRDDGVYDVVLDMRCNRGPIRKGRGSAIFIHLARTDFSPTAGCVALRPADMRRLLPRLAPIVTIVVRR